MPAKEYPGFYALEKNHLRLSLKVKEQHPKAVPVLNPSTRPEFLTFILERGKGPLGKSTGAKDEDRIVGSWDVVAHFDDGDDYTNRGRFLSITKDRLEWKADPKAVRSSVEANYKLHPDKSPPWIDFLNTKPVRAGVPSPLSRLQVLVDWATTRAGNGILSFPARPLSATTSPTS
jgi:hypothetical protein